MVDLPTPQFAIGDTIYVPGYESGTEQAPCPDCLGAGKWPVTSPAGEEHSVRCPTCLNGGWGCSTGKITFYKASPTAARLTVGSVRIDTAAKDGECVSYMCSETGIGSGSVYYECKCFADEESALRAAALLADAQTARIREQNKKSDELKVLPIQSAATKSANDRAFEAEYALEDLKRKIIDLESEGYLFSTASAATLRGISLHLVGKDDPMREDSTQ